MANKKVLLLLAQGFEMYEASVFIDVITWNRVELLTDKTKSDYIRNIMGFSIE